MKPFDLDMPDIPDVDENPREASRQFVERSRPFFDGDETATKCVSKGVSALPLIHVPSWSGTRAPLRRWLVFNRVLMGTVAMLTGDGAAGKTTIALQLAMAVVRGTDWLGAVIDAPGPVIFLSAEEDHDEIHRRLEAIVEHHSIGLADLDGLHVIGMPGEDCVLGIADKTGVLKPTPLFAALERRAVDLQPSLIIIESAADVFAGNENDRSQVRQFISILRRLGIASGAAVLLIAHPSLSGMASGTGTSGSTGWNNSVRSRLYFTGSKAKDGDDDDKDARELKVMKSNYGPAGETVRLRWKDGVFVLDTGKESGHRKVAENLIDDAYLACLDEVNSRDQSVSPSPSKTYAPTVFERMEQAKGYKSKALEAAQNRLLSARRIEIVTTGSASRQRKNIQRRAGE